MTTSTRTQSFLPGVRIRGELDGPSGEPAVNDAFDGTAAAYDFLQGVFGRDPLDRKRMELVSTVHYGVDFDNGFSNSAQVG